MGADGDPEDADREATPDATADESTGQSDDPFAFEDYYDLLGVSPDASRETVERAYRDMAKRHHPDASDRPEAEAERRFRQLLAARDVLTTVETRRAYDELGHAEYRRQSESLGEPVRRTDSGGTSPGSDDVDPGPEPRPSPGASDDRPAPGRVQRSARGEARRRGDPLVTSADEAFAGGDGAASSGHTTEADTSGRGVYGLVFDDGPPESRSLRYVAGRWASSWRNRLLVGVGSVTLGVAVPASVSSLLAAAGPDVSVPSASTVSLYLLAVVAVLAHAVYSSATAEATLPRGQFLADRDLGRFSTAASRRYRRRGALTALVALALAVAGARNGGRPWTRTADALRGDFASPFPWFDAGAVGLADWTTPLGVLATGVFALAAVLGTAALALGTSAELWRARYGRGLDVHPGLWEWPFALALASLCFALGAGPLDLFALSAVSGLPETVATVAAVEGEQVTLATVAVAGMVLALATHLLSRLRLALASTGTGSDADDSRQH